MVFNSHWQKTDKFYQTHRNKLAASLHGKKNVYFYVHCTYLKLEHSACVKF